MIAASLDGYAYNPFGRRGREGWPGFDPADADPKSPSERVERAKRMCTIKRDECFAIKAPNGGAPRASDIFKHIAFDRTECGDCSECPYPLPLGTGRPLRHAGRVA